MLLASWRSGTVTLAICACLARHVPPSVFGFVGASFCPIGMLRHAHTTVHVVLVCLVLHGSIHEVQAFFSLAFAMISSSCAVCTTNFTNPNRFVVAMKADLTHGFRHAAKLCRDLWAKPQRSLASRCTQHKNINFKKHDSQNSKLNDNLKDYHKVTYHELSGPM